MGARTQAVGAGALAGLVLLAGCSVHVNKAGNGEDKDVSIHTPFGGLQVRDNKSAVDTGLPTYPGAVLEPDKDDNSKSVDLHVGFGEWQVRVQVANFATADPQSKVEDYYRTALGRYGQVLRCRNNQPIGEPTRTSEGLTCSDSDHNGHGPVHTDTGDTDLELKAGSERKQHIVAFKKDGKAGPGTHFALIALTLPAKDHHNESEE